MSASFVHVDATMHLLYQLHAEHHTGWFHEMPNCWQQVCPRTHDQLMHLHVDHDLHAGLETWLVTSLTMQLGNPNDEHVSSYILCVALSTSSHSISVTPS